LGVVWRREKRVYKKRKDKMERKENYENGGLKAV